MVTQQDTGNPTAEWENRYKGLVEKANDGIYLVDGNSRKIISANPALAKMYGYTIEELEGMGVSDLLFQDEMLQCNDVFRRTSQREEVVEEFCVRKKNGDPIWVEIKPVLIELGGEGVVMSVARDITERKRLEKELRASVAHGINNLLTEILLRAERIEKDSNDSGAVIRDAKAIEETVQSAAAIVTRFQTSAQQSLPAKVTVNINHLVLETVEITRLHWHDAPEREGRLIEMRTQLNATLPLVGDPAGLREVLYYLIFNSVDAMPEGGTITIKSDQEEGYVLLSVSDTGTGMDEETRRRVFEPFFSTKGTGAGRGLGLSTVHSIVRQHRGEIDVDSAPGQGTTFTLRLPTSPVGS